MARVTYDDSRITSTEFRIRRTAIGLEFSVMMEHMGVSKPAIDKWHRGSVLIPQYAREFLEKVEGDVAGMVEILVESRDQLLDDTPPHGWPWGEKCWYVVVSRAAYELRQMGVDTVIGETAKGRTLRMEDPATQAMNQRVYLGSREPSLGSSDEATG